MTIVGKIWNGTKSAINFMDPTWGSKVGAACNRARKAGTATIMSYDWGKGYDTYQKTAKCAEEIQKAAGVSVIDAAKKARIKKVTGIRKAALSTAKETVLGKGFVGEIPQEARKAVLDEYKRLLNKNLTNASRNAARKELETIAASKGIKADASIMNKALRQLSKTAADKAGKKPSRLSKIGSWIGKIPGLKSAGKLLKGVGSKILGPIFIGLALYNGWKEGGLVEGLKEATKVAISFAGFAVCAAACAALGMTGIGAFVVPLLGSFVIDKMATGVLGKSMAEKREELAEMQQQQQQMQMQNVAATGVDMNKIQHCLDDVKQFSQMQNNATNPFMYGNGLAVNRNCY